jgi:hypothetical protein
VTTAGGGADREGNGPGGLDPAAVRRIADGSRRRI